ncbi:acyltransferase family protein [Pantoea dispersa]|uniref:acyltransferase family protein n=1 Tax=Pantoea dispersa TaxID=59814 RepID=UPI0021F7A4EA|nr:acyltransferase [Pantoea dispersa]UYP74775.1 acyltransferase [Pantoea dispersa]
MRQELFYILLILILFIIGAWYVFILGKRLGVEANESVGFSNSLEVLRGIAAFLVFGAHSTMYFGYARNQVVAAAMGEIGVLLFFMLTGHLFWGQIKAGAYKAESFFYKRACRLVPAMFVMISCVMLLDWVTHGLSLPNKDQLIALIRNYGFGFGSVVNSVGNVNDVFSKDMFLRINNIWTLRWEWLFYFVLPLLATLKRFSLVTLFSLFVIILFMQPFQIMTGTTDIVFIAAFWLGALTAELEGKREGLLRILFTRISGYIMLIAGVSLTLFYLFQTPLTQKNVRVPIMIFTVFPVFFFFVINKWRQNILVSWKPAQVLGKVSYSFYLWHLAVNFYVITIANKTIKNPQALLSFVLICAVMMIVSLTISVFSFKYVEDYFLKKSHRKAILKG